MLVLMVGALLLVGCQKSVPVQPAPAGQAVAPSEDQQIASSIDDLNDLDSIDQNLDSDLKELDNLSLE